MPTVSRSFLPQAARQAMAASVSPGRAPKSDGAASAGQNKIEGPIKIKAAAAMLGVSEVTIRRRVNDGSLPHLRIKGRLYFKRSELHAYLEAHRGNLGG